jgi:DNA-binding MarR family transcriptional regulator
MAGVKPAVRPAPLRLVPQIHRATHGIGLHIASALGVTQAEAHVLQHLASQGDCTVGDLHRAFAHRRSTLTSVLDRLAERGLIDRVTSETDRRTFVISLTSSGRSVALEVHAELQRVEKRALGSLASRDLKGFTAVMAAIERTLASTDDSA